MKSVILASLLLLGVSNAFGVSIEKNDISIEYNICEKHSIPGVGKPYCITISNHSKKPITLDSAIVTVPLQSNEEIVKEAHNELKKTILFSSIPAGILGYSSYNDFKLMGRACAEIPLGFPNLQNSLDEISRWTKLRLGSAIAFGILSTYALYKLLLGTVVDQNKLLDHPFTIKPGESIKKLFWLKNPNAQVKIDFDAIKVLK